MINNSSRLNAVVDNVRKYAICEEVIGEKYKVMSNKHPSRITNQICKSNTIRNHQECFKGETNKNILTVDLQKEESLPHNIKPEETSMISYERFVLYGIHIRMKRHVCFIILRKEYLYQKYFIQFN